MPVLKLKKRGLTIFIVYPTVLKLVFLQKPKNIVYKNAISGGKKKCFHYGANAPNFNEKLLLEHPKLSNGGGFEILRSGGNRGALTVIKPPSTGYSVRSCGIRQGWDKL